MYVEGVISCWCHTIATLHFFGVGGVGGMYSTEDPDGNVSTCEVLKEDSPGKSTCVIQSVSQAEIILLAVKTVHIDYNG